MSDVGGSGRYEPEKRLCGGPGLVSARRCDECQRDSTASRRKAKVVAGPLRGLVGMVCRRCLTAREKDPA